MRFTNPVPVRRHKNGWTPERRARQAAAIRNWRPWTRSTGPRTESGKRRVRNNGWKTGMSSQAMRQLRQAMKKQRAFLSRFTIQWQKHFREQRRQLNALQARHNKKKQLRQSVRSNKAEIFVFSTNQTN
jgi:hypothetical protein